MFMLTPDLSSKIDIGFERVPVRPYILNLLKDMKCQNFGHTKFNCRRNYACPCCFIEKMKYWNQKYY